MEDHITKATAEGIRVFAAVTTKLAAEAAERHGCYPVAAAVLGRVLTGAALLAANLKTKECITLKVAGDGPLGQIVADASADGALRGYVQHPQVDLPLRGGKLAVGAGVGKGILSVTRFTGLKQPFQGSAELVSGEIAEDLTHYLYVSEQTPSSVALGVLADPVQFVRAAGGFFVQALPNVPEESLAQLEENLKALPPVSRMIDEGLRAEEIIARVLTGMHVNFFDAAPLVFRCQCSKARVADVLLSLGEKEIASLVSDGGAEVCCHFCGGAYRFDAAELAALEDAARRRAR